MKTIKNIVLLIASISLMFLTACQQQELSDTKYFKITESELLDKLNANYEEDLELKNTVYINDGTLEVLVYACCDDGNEIGIEYTITCDKSTRKVSSIDFRVTAGFPDSMEVYEKILIYVVQIVSPSTASEYLENMIENIYDKSIYIDEPYDNFNLFASYNPWIDYLEASVIPNNEMQLFHLQDYL